MRKLLIAAALVAATATVPATASADAAYPDLCDYLANTMCDAPDRLLPSYCEIEEKLGVVHVRECEEPFASVAVAQPDLPESSCEVIRNTICHLIPPRSPEDVCAIVEATTAFGCTVSATRT